MARWEPERGGDDFPGKLRQVYSHGTEPAVYQHWPQQVCVVTTSGTGVADDSEHDRCGHAAGGNSGRPSRWHPCPMVKQSAKQSPSKCPGNPSKTTTIIIIITVFLLLFPGYSTRTTTSLRTF